MISLQGTGIGGGIVIGRARVLDTGSRDVPRRRIAQDEAPAEQERLKEALSRVRGELSALSAGLPREAPSEAAALIVQLAS